MARELSGNLITMAFTTDLTYPYDNLKTIVCEEDSEGGLDSNVSSTPTKCGVFTSTEIPTGTISGNGVTNADPESDEASFQDILNLVNNQTRVFAIYQNAAESPDVTEGQGVYMAGLGYFNTARSTNTQGTQSRFSWGFTFTGDIDTEYPTS